MARGTWGTGVLDPNIFKVIFRFMLGNENCSTSLKVRDVGVQDNSPEDVANVLVPWFNDHFRTVLGTQDTLVAVDVLKLGTDQGFTHTFTNVHGTATIGDTIRIPSAMAVNIAMKSEIRKRYGQGRMFWPVRAEGAIDGDVINASEIAALQDILDNLAGLITGSPATHDLILVNAHGTLPPKAATAHSPARPEIPPSWYDVTSLQIKAVVTWLRSRKVGVGS